MTATGELRYKVLVDDNFHYQDGGERYEHGNGYVPIPGPNRIQRLTWLRFPRSARTHR